METFMKILLATFLFTSALTVMATGTFDILMQKTLSEQGQRALCLCKNISDKLRMLTQQWGVFVTHAAVSAVAK